MPIIMGFRLEINGAYWYFETQFRQNLGIGIRLNLTYNNIQKLNSAMVCVPIVDELYGKEDWYIEMKKEVQQKE